jgi:hypothetical protein
MQTRGRANEPEYVAVEERRFSAASARPYQGTTSVVPPKSDNVPGFSR